MKFSEKLKQAMQQLGINQAQVVGLTGKSKGSISMYLNDKTTPSEQVCMSKYAMYDNFEVGDVVVVKTGHHGLAVAKIASIDDTVSRVANGREIVTKVDMGTYENRVASRKRVSELKTAMDVRINKLQRMAVLEMFSEKDPEMKALLDEYKALTEQKGEVQKDGE